MSYDDHRIPADTVLGGADNLGKGMHQILSSLELGRINIAARAVGVARAAFDAAFDYSQQRETFGVPIIKHQAIAFKLAEMATKLQAAKLMVKSIQKMRRKGKTSRQSLAHLSMNTSFSHLSYGTA